MSEECIEAEESAYALLGTMEYVVGGYMTIMLAVVGVVANIMAVMVLATREGRNNFSYLLISLAVFDLLFLLLSIVESVRKTFEERVGNGTDLGGLFTQYHHHLFPYFLHPFHNILLTCSIFMTISISIERYLVIFHNNYYKKRSGFCTIICHVIPVIFLSIIINIPVFFASKVMVSGEATWLAVTDLRLSYLYIVYYQHWTRFLALGVLPFLLLSFLNFRIFFKIFKNSNNIRDLTYFIITLLIVVIFFLCHLPRLVLNFYEAIYSEYIMTCGPPVWSLIFHVFSNSLLPVINSTSNFFVYILAGKHFRENLVKLFECVEEAKKEVSDIFFLPLKFLLNALHNSFD